MPIIIPPRERACERCGRREVWDDRKETWVAGDANGKSRGTPHCLHEWDITGTYNPIEGTH